MGVVGAMAALLHDVDTEKTSPQPSESVLIERTYGEWVLACYGPTLTVDTHSQQRLLKVMRDNGTAMVQFANIGSGTVPDNLYEQIVGEFNGFEDSLTLPAHTVIVLPDRCEPKV